MLLLSGLLAEKFSGKEVREMLSSSSSWNQKRRNNSEMSSCSLNQVIGHFLSQDSLLYNHRY